MTKIKKTYLPNWIWFHLRMCLTHLQDLRLLKRVQRRWTKQVGGLEALDYSDRSLQLYSVQGRLMRADLLLYWKIFHSKSCISKGDLFLVSPQTLTRGHCFKIHCPHCRTEIRQWFFSVRVIDVWKSLPDYVVNASCIGPFKKMLNVCIPELLYSYVD